MVIATVITINLLLGLVVLKRSFSKVNLSFFVMVVVSSFWAAIVYVSDFKFSSPGLVLLLNRLTFTAAILLVSAFYAFTYYFPVTLSKKGFYNTIIYVISAITFLLTLTPLTIKSVSEKSWGWNIESGPFYWVFLAAFSLILISSFYQLFRKQKNLSGIQKVQLKFMILGTLLTAIFATLTNLIIPLLTGSNPMAKYGGLWFVFLIAFTSYAIIKHRLMDIRMVVARSVSYSLLVAILAGFYAGAVLGIERLFFPESLTGFNWTQGIIRTILAVLMAFSFQPLRRWITKVTDKIFFKNAYDPEALLDDVSHTVSSTIVLVEMMYKTLQLLSKEMKVTRGIIVVLTDSGSIYTSQSIGYTVALKIDADEMVKLSKDGILLYDELDERSHYKKLLRKYDASVAVPIRTNTDCVGVLLLGEKASGDMYSQADHQIFEIIAPELAVAITNAKSFEKIEKFNVTLRQEIKKATHELEKKNDQLRELDKAKDEFISMASHQLRTPLTAIKGYLSMLLEGDAGEIKVSQYDFVNEAYQGANRMVGLINDLLNVSRMETGRFFLEPTEVDMERVAAEEVKQLLNHAKEKKLKLTLKVKGKTPRVTVDETKIRQVMMNFIDNAVYYTTEGSVTVTLEHDKKDVIFKVTDTGIGVPKEAQKNLFTKFYRADNARHVRPDGTGLGIYLAKRVMDDHHGELIFHSEEGKGSVFGFKLPIKSKITMQPASAPAPTGQAVGPAIGELAAGIGVNPKTLEATQVQNGPTVTPSSAIANGDVIASKAAGIEPPLTEGQSKS